MEDYEMVNYILVCLIIAVDIVLVLGIIGKLIRLCSKVEVKDNDVECELVFNTHTSVSEFSILKVTDILVSIQNLDRYDLNKRTKKYKYRDVLTYSNNKYKNNLCKNIVKRIDFVIHRDFIEQETLAYVKNLIRELNRAKNTNASIISKIISKDLSEPYVLLDTNTSSDNGLDVYVYASNLVKDMDEKSYLKIRIKTERKEK